MLEAVGLAYRWPSQVVASGPEPTGPLGLLPLSLREREIASLIAADLSNPEIAERFTRGGAPWQVVCTEAVLKLDVSDREGPAALLGRARATRLGRFPFVVRCCLNVG
jgi:DNA-binding NarL/FixJ family response regulator